MKNEDVERLIKYVLAFAGDECSRCVGETIYKFFGEFYDDIEYSLEDLYKIAESTNNDIFHVSAESMSEWNKFITINNYQYNCESSTSSYKTRY